ncbi:MAG TPA: PKD domain-containing protein [Bacteroidia bacterium]|jgi:gliding motility-associated-like protein|nr:PKD domain-containing protein [Bacteroidia bacterium]
MKKFIILTVTLLLTLSFISRAGEQPKNKWVLKEPFERKEFIENKGQYQLGKRASMGDILFGARREGLHYYFTKNCIWVKTFVKMTRTEYELEKFKEAMGESKEGEEKGEDNLVKYKWVEQFHKISFDGAGINTTIVAEDKVSNVYKFNIESKYNITAEAYKKIIYKNLYPGIDMEFIFPEDKQGFKYTFIVHPGADASIIKMSYPTHKGDLKQDANGNIVIKSLFGNFTDHAPVANLEKENTIVNCSFNLLLNTVKFNVGKYDKSKTLVIDPWTTSPGFVTPKAYDVDWDKAGNCYAYGGTTPFQLVKLSPAGTIIWTYTTTFGFASYYGDFAMDRSSGSSYIVDGFNGGGAQALKVNSAGAQVAIYNGNPLFQEMWRIVFSRCTNQAVIAGGGTSNPSYTGCYLDTTLVNMNPVNVINSPTGLHDMWGITIDAFGSAYFATAKTQVGSAGYDNYIFKVPTPALTPITYSVATTYSFVEVASVNYAPGPPNGFNGMVMSNVHLYTYDSYNLTKWNSGTGAVLGNASVNGASQSTMAFGGLTADECDHVFVGSSNTVKEYDGTTMSQISSIATTSTVCDVSLGNNNILYVCGAGFVQAIQLNLLPCSILQTTDQVTNGTCNNPVGSATITVTGGTSPYTITWNTTPVQNGPVITGVPTGTYVATIIDNSCIKQTTYDTVVVTSNGGVTLTPQVTNIPCFGASSGAVTLTVTPTGTVVPTFTWSTGAQTQSIANVPAGIYTLTVGTGGPCNMVATYTVTQPPPLSFTLNPGTINCFGDTTSIGIAVSGGTPHIIAPKYSVTWGPPVATGLAVHGLGAGNYGGTIKDSLGCVATYTTLLTQPPKIATGYTFTIGCLGTPVQFTDQSTGGPFTYNWNYGDGTAAGIIQNPQHTYAAPGTYTTALVVTNSNNCKDTLKHVITVDPPPQAAFTGDTLTGCPVHSVKFTDNSTCTAGTIVNWLWDFGNGISSVSQFPTNIFYNNTSATVNANYIVTLTIVNSKGCTSKVVKNNYITVYPHPQPGFYFASDDGSQIDVLNNNVHFYSTATGATIYDWYLGDIFANPFSTNYSTVTNPVHQYANSEPYTYYVTQVVKNQYGCKDSVTEPIPVRPVYTFYIPNSFSPNGDGVNEGFKGSGYGVDNTTFKMYIFDRWGNQIFTSNDIDKAWDGRINNKGDVVLEDIYVWKVNFADIMGLKHEYHGIVSVVK